MYQILSIMFGEVLKKLEKSMESMEKLEKQIVETNVLLNDNNNTLELILEVLVEIKNK